MNIGWNFIKGDILEIFINELKDLCDTTKEDKIKEIVFRNGLITEELYEDIADLYKPLLLQYHTEKVLKQIEVMLLPERSMISIFPNVVGETITVRIYSEDPQDTIWMLEGIFHKHNFYVDYGLFIDEPALKRVKLYKLIFKKRNVVKSIKESIESIANKHVAQVFFKGEKLKITKENAVLFELYEYSTGVKDLIMTVFADKPKAYGIHLMNDLAYWYEFKCLKAYPSETYNGYKTYKFHLTNYK